MIIVYNHPKKYMKKSLKYLAVILLIILFVVSIVPKFFQNDTFYMISLGKLILENGIDGVDHYSWHSDLEYRYPHWAFDVVTAGIFNSFGLDGIYVLVCVISVIFMLVIYWLMLKKGIHWFIAFISTCMVAYLIKDFFTGRAQIISYLLFLIQIQLIESFIKNRNKASVFGMFVISCIIANIHATIWIMTLVLFLPYIGEFVINRLTLTEISNISLKKYKKKLEKLKAKGKDENSEKFKKIQAEIKHYEDFNSKYKPREDTKIIIKKYENEKWLFIPIIFVILGALLTPIGITPFTYYLKTSIGNSQSYINEHQPIIIGNNLPFLVSTIILVALFGFTDSKIKLSDAFLILGLYIMSIIATRNVYLLIILCVIPVVKMINDFIFRHNSFENVDKSYYKFRDIIFTIICILIFIYCIYNIVFSWNDKYLPENVYPIEAVKYIKNNLEVENIKLYNGYDYGSYLLFNNIPVFIDSRCDLYTPEFNKGITVLDDFMDGMNGKEHFSNIFDKYEITHALVTKDSIESVYMEQDNRCELLYEDDNFVVYKYNSDNQE